MGKRRERTRGCDHNKDDSSLLLSSSSDGMPCSSGFVLSKKKKYPRSVASKESKPPGASGMDMAADCSIKQQLNAQMSSHPRHNLGESMFLKWSRHGHQQHPWRNSSNNFRASTSHGRSSNWDDSLSFKLGGHYKHEEYGYAEARERMFGMTERITAAEGSLPDAMRMPCGICHNLLWERPVVAVLVCGHLYHADCVERKTSPEDKCDPPCPICSGKP